MKDVLILVGVLAIVFFVGTYIFNKIVERLLYKWVVQWSKEWGVDTELQLKAVKHVQAWLSIGYKQPNFRHFKSWWKDTYWAACIIHDPMLPVKMKLKADMATALQEEEDRQILYGDGGKW